ncbi:MAG TPA: extracellular solute-binding protein [Pseudonocardia sp.]|nr:extracellular solute-binding protein [Pseudonocardia sp.]
MSLPPPASGVSRRRFLGGALGGAAAVAAAGALGGCAAPGGGVTRHADAGPWRQYAGSTLNFISENTAPTAAIAANVTPFTELTGINLNIVTLELSALVQKVALDLASGHSTYQAIYADPYQVLAPYSKGLVDLRELMADQALPQVPLGVGDFIPTHLEAAGKFVSPDTIFALPYDCPTLIWQYRRDLFEKYRDRMAHDLGFDPMPGDASTWDQYYAIARWFNDNARDDVPYGTGHQAKQHDSLMNDFSNVLWAYGGDYFDNGRQVGGLGTVDPGPCRLDSPAAIEAANFYSKLLSIAHPGSLTWDWDGLGNAFAAGQVAMCPNWHEYAASNESKLPGKVDYAPLPRGPVRSGNMYGGTGLGISASTTGDERRAAWLFAVWATSPEIELANLKSTAGGGTPTRTSVYQLPEVVAAEHRPSPMPNILTAPAVAKAWQPENIGLRPKIPMWNECDTAIFTQLSRMLAGDTTPAEAMRATTDQVNRIVARGWVASS